VGAGFKGRRIQTARPKRVGADPMIVNPALFVEPDRWAGGYLRRGGSLGYGPFGGVFDERTPDTAAHPAWFDEQPVELVDSVVAGDDDREAERSLVLGYRNPDPTALDETLKQLDRVRVGRQLRAVLGPYVGRAALQALECRCFASGCIVRVIKSRPL